MSTGVAILPVHGIPEVKPGDDIAQLITEALHTTSLPLMPDDVVVVTQKIVSKAEGRFADPQSITPSSLARAYAEQAGKPPGEVELAFSESRRIVRMAPYTLILETHHGFVCANAGIDYSNVAGDQALLLPVDPDASAARVRAGLLAAWGVQVAVIISDTFGRPWRMGQTNVAIGVAGMSPFNDYRGQLDAHGRELNVTQLAVADELASAAELVQNKVDQVPVAIIRGYRYAPGSGKATELVRPAEKDLFR